MAPDDLLGFDEERVRQVIDALIHPVATAGRAEDGERREATEPRDRFERRTSPASAVRQRATRPGGDELGLCRSDTWHRLLEIEHACAGRYGTKTTLVQLEIVDIGLLATLLGETAAARLVHVLADTIREDTRGSDAYARLDRWRFAGLLLQTDGRSADHALRRIGDGLQRRLGSRLPLRMAAGRAELDPRLDAAASMARAEGSMHLEARRSVSSGGPAQAIGSVLGAAAGDSGGVGRGGGAVLEDTTPPVSDGTALQVPESLRELARLHADGLVSDEEYRKARRRILRRI